MIYAFHYDLHLIPSPLLISLCFNFDTHLARVQQNFQDADLSHVCFDPIDLATTLEQGTVWTLWSTFLKDNGAYFAVEFDNDELEHSQSHQNSNTDNYEIDFALKAT